MPVVVLEKCDSYLPDRVGRAVERALAGSLGSGFADLAGHRILLKPNLTAARDPARGVTTHPSVVGAAIDFFKARGAEVSVGDSPAGAVRGVRRVWENTGMLELCQSKGVSLVNFEAGGWVSRSVNDRTYQVARVLFDFDHIVNIPKLKAHILTLLTGAIKNMFGCVPGFRKSRLHLANPGPSEMSQVLVDIFSIVRPWVSLVDSIEAMEGNGPSSGSIRKLGFVAASTDSVALDAVLASIVGLEPRAVPTTVEAYRRGLGELSMNGIGVKGCRLADVTAHGFEIPGNWRFRLIPGILGKFLEKIVWVRPEINTGRCTGCEECRNMCAAGAIAIDSGKAEIDHARCTSCLCCHEACPVGAVRIRMSGLARLLA
jgi:uncharacterized protein (DUF362 family)/ferredoxin